jgi:Fe-S oxidoreductase
VKKPELLVDLAHRAIDRLEKLGVTEAPRYHDPCQLGRGLGRYDEPRALLSKLAGAPPHEFDRAREGAECSGGGGMLPHTYPATSAAIAATRIESHRASGGGTLVTACAGSLRRFRTAGEPAEDLVTWLARGLGVSRDGS